MQETDIKIFRYDDGDFWVDICEDEDSFQNVASRPFMYLTAQKGRFIGRHPTNKKSYRRIGRIKVASSAFVYLSATNTLAFKGSRP